LTGKDISEKSILTKTEQVLTAILLGLLGVYLLFRNFEKTTFLLSIPGSFLKYLFLITSVMAAVRILLRPKLLTQYFLPVICAFAYALVYLRLRYWSLLYLGLFIVAFRGINYRYVLKVFTVCLFAVLIITFSAATLGGIENYVYLKDGYIRSSLGIQYPTDMASMVLFLLMFCWLAWDWMTDITAILLGIVSVWFCKYIAMSVTSTMCSMLFVGIVTAHLLYQKIPVLHKLPEWFKKIVKGGLIFSFPLFALLFFGLMLAYMKGIGPAFRIDNILSSRIELAVNAYREYGISLLGHFFTMIGNGGSTFTNPDYNFIDSSYPLILIRYGALLFIIICITWTCSLWRAVQNKDWRLVGVMFLIGVHSFSEHHFIEANYNILLAMPFAAYPAINESVYARAWIKNTNNSGQRRIIGAGVCVLCMLFFGYIAGPRIISCGRTVVDLLGWKGSTFGNRWLILLLVQAYGLLAVFIAALYGLVISGGSHPGKSLICCGMAGVCVFLLVSGANWGNQVISQENQKLSKTVESDTKGLTDIFSLAEGKVYIDRVPELYRKAFPEVSTSVFKADDLARLYDTTVVMDINYDSNCFINSGFLFTPISEYSAIYTNDLSVVHGLQEKGYHVTGFYSHEKEVDLQLLAKENGLEYSDGVIHLNGDEQSIRTGPHFSLYTGPYTIIYDLSAKEDYSDDRLLGFLQVTAYNDSKTLNEVVVYGKDIDESGKYIDELSFYSSGYQDINFRIITEADVKLNVQKLTIKRTPLYDTHSFYNTKRKRYRDEFYSLDGRPIITSDGYFACEYKYNANNAVIEARYYDELNKLTITKNGYAIVDRKLNEKDQIIAEAYYGTDGKPIMLPQGYYSDVRVNDERGNIVKQKYLNEKGDALNTVFGYAEIHRVFNDKNQIICESYYGPDGNPVMMKPGYSMLKKEYDSSGNPTVLRYCDLNGEPVETSWGYAETHRVFNGKKQIIQESYYDTHQNMIQMPQGYFVNEREYDEYGNAIVQRYLDDQYNPVMIDWGDWKYCEVHREFNNLNQVIKESYYDLSGQMVQTPGGYYIENSEYDTAGNLTVKRYQDKNGSLITTVWGYSEVNYIYDSDGQLINTVKTNKNEKENRK